MYTFPTLSVYPTYPFDEEQEDVTLKSKSEDGILLTRPKYTKTRNTYNVNYDYLTKEDKHKIESFVKTVNQGVDIFYWNHPNTNISETWQANTEYNYGDVVKSSDGTVAAKCITDDRDPVYESDFSSGVDGWVNSTYTTLLGGQTVSMTGGWLKMTNVSTGVAGSRYCNKNAILTVGKQYSLTFTYYFPNSNINATGISLWASGNIYNITTPVRNKATTITTTFTASNTVLYIYLSLGAGYADTHLDHIYLKDITITELPYSNYSEPGTPAYNGLQSYYSYIQGGITVSSITCGGKNTGIQDFSLHFEGALPDWTPTAGGGTPLIDNYSIYGGYQLFALTSGSLRLYLYPGKYYDSIAHNFVDGSNHKITTTVQRETALTNGYVSFYDNGSLLGYAITITAAAATLSMNYTGGMGILCNRSTSTQYKFNGIVHRTILFNRALSSTEVLDLATNGVDEKDQWGTVYRQSYSSNFTSTVDGWTATGATTLSYNIDSIGGDNDWLRFTCNSASSTHYIQKDSVLTANKLYRLVFTYYIPSANSNIDSIVVSTSTKTIATLTDVGTVNARSYDFMATDGVDLIISAYDGASATFTDAGGDDLFYIKDINLYQIDCVYNSDFSSGDDYWLGNWYGSGNAVTGNQDGIGTIAPNDWLKITRTTITTGRLSGHRGITSYSSTASSTLTTPNKNCRRGITLYNANVTITTFEVFDGSSYTGTTFTCPVGSQVTVTWPGVTILDASVSIYAFVISPVGNITTGQYFYVKDAYMYHTGAILDLEPEGIQDPPNPWLDSSDSQANATLPTTGVVLKECWPTDYEDTINDNSITWQNISNKKVRFAELPVFSYVENNHWKTSFKLMEV